MGRPVTGMAYLGDARAFRDNAETAEDLRLAVAVLLPLEQGLSIKQTADIIGRSVSVTCSMRTRFGRVIEGVQAVPQHKQQLRNRAHADLMIEAQVLDEVLANAATGGVVIIARLKPAIEAKLGKSMALSGIYRMLARHGWRKLAPDTRHPQGDPAAREEWKKNSPATWVKS
jgi:transposase